MIDARLCQPKLTKLIPMFVCAGEAWFTLLLGPSMMKLGLSLEYVSLSGSGGYDFMSPRGFRTVGMQSPPCSSTSFRFSSIALTC